MAIFFAISRSFFTEYIFFLLVTGAGVSGVTPPKKKKKDPNAPKSVISAYTFFFRDKQATIKEQNPKTKFGDISKIVSQLWKALGETEKAVYKQKNAEDKLRYEKELEAYKAGLETGK